MFKLIIMSCVFAISACALADDIEKLTSEQVMTESQKCGESHYDESNCKLKSNCVFVHWRVKQLNEVLRLCMSYNEIMKYYIKDPARYLKSTKTKTHKTINKTNFCDVMDDSENFMDQEGHLERCIVSTA